jgi:hypothetical protein
MTDRREEPELAALLKRILEECRNPGRVIELYYWSAERDLADVMRQYIALTPEVRAALHAFLMLVKDEPRSVTVQIAESGEMTFSAPAAAELAKRITNPGVPPPFLH